MQITASARKHGVSDADIKHAFQHALRYAEIDYDDEMRMLVIGPAADGTLLELVAVPSGAPQRIIHADRLRPKFYDALR